MILVDIKMPKNCEECPLLKLGEYGAFEKSRCGVYNARISKSKRPKECGLKMVCKENKQ